MAGTVGKGFWKVNPLRIYGFVLQRAQTLFVLSCYKTIIWHWWLFWFCLYFNEWELHNNNFPMQILKWLKKESLSARGRRQGESQGQTASRGWKLCKVLASIVLLCCDVHFQLCLPPIPSHLRLFYLARKGKTNPKCFIPLVCVCLLTWLCSVTPFLKGLACFTWYILVPVFKSHIFSCRPQASGKWESVSGAFSAFDMILKTNTLIWGSCFTHFYYLNPLW